MKQYIELSPAKKLRLLNEHKLFVGAEWDHLNQTRWCHHCESEINGHSVRVYLEDGELWLQCGTPGCNGSPKDWADHPWWDADHPLTIEADAKMAEEEAKEAAKMLKKKKR